MEQDLPVDRSLDGLRPEQRAHHYRKLAKDAFRKAQKTSDPDRRAEYISMASSWHAMASEMGRLTDFASPGQPAADE